MTLLRNSFEGGTLDDGLTGSNMGGASGDQPNVVTINGAASVVFDDTHVAHDSVAAKWTSATASLAFVAYTSLSTQQCAARIYLYATALASADYWLIRMEDSAGSSIAILKWNAAGALRVQDSASATVWTAPAAFPLNQWVRVDLFVNRATGKIRATQALLDAAPTYDSGLLTANVGANAIDTVKFGDMSTSQVIAVYWADDLAVDPAATDVIPYTAPCDAGPDQTVPEGTTIELGSTGTGTPDWTQDSGPAITITNPGTATPTAADPLPGHYVFRVTYDGGSTDTVNVYVTTATSLPESVISNAGAWTTDTGSSDPVDLIAALTDSPDVKWIQSPDNPAGNVIEVQVEPLAPGQVTVDYAVSQDVASPARTCKVELMMGGTSIASKTENLTTAGIDGSFVLTPTQLTALTGRNDLRLRYTAS